MIFTIEQNRPIAAQIHEMVLSGDTAGITAPGQFVHIRLDGLFLRRPISVCDWDARTLTILYKLVGRGTRAMSAYRPGRQLDLLTGLGNGYDLAVDTHAPLLVGGGVGVPPLYALAKALIALGKSPTVILGFNTAPEAFYEREFLALGARTIVCTMDGSRGETGFATAPMARLTYDHIFACGPEPMLRAVAKASGDIPGQLSFEERMGCGFGACMGCSCQTLVGPKRICVDGPVMRKEEIIWTCV